MLPTQHYLLDAQLEDSTLCSQGTFLVPSAIPRADYWQYAVVLDECTGIHHVARKATVVYNDSGSLSGKMKRKRSTGIPKKTTKNLELVVELPTRSEVMLEKFDVNMPIFRSYHDERFPLSSESGFMPTPDAAEMIFDTEASIQSERHEVPKQLDFSSIDTIDNTIIASGRPIHRSNAAQLVPQPSIKGSVPVSETKNKAFFQSLLAKKNDGEEIIEGQLTPAKVNHTTNKAFFESLLTHEGIVREQCPEASLTHESGFKLPSRSHLTLAQKYTSTASWVNVRNIYLDRIPGSLDLAVTNLDTKPFHILSELDLDVTSWQAFLLQEDCSSHLPAMGKGAAPVDEPSNNNIMRYASPVAPRGDSMSYEEYGLSRSRSSSAFSTSMTTSPGSSNSLDTNQLSTNSTATPTSKDDLALVLKQRSSEESEWLDLAQAFHRSAKTANADASIIEHSMGVSQNLVTCTTSVNLPWIDKRDTRALELPKDSTVDLVVPCSAETFLSGFERDESFPHVLLPNRHNDTRPADSEQLSKTHNADLKPAMEALDLAAIFGGNANDWSDDGDCYTSELGEKDGLEPLANHASTERNQTDDYATANHAFAEGACASEQPLEIDSTKSRTPLYTLHRLPAPLIKAINLEFIHLRDTYEPSMVGENNMIYEQALANIKPMFEQVPDDILFWVHEVNMESLRIYSEGPRNGGLWDVDLQFDQMTALALSNVEWHYLCHSLKNYPTPINDKPFLEAAESPKECLMDLMGCGHESRQCSAYGQSASQKEEVNGDAEADESTDCQHSTPVLHHINFNGDFIYKRSCTPPAVSFWAICTTRYKRHCDTSGSYKALPAVHLKSVLAAQAFKAVDPVQRLGSNTDAPTDAFGDYLTGSRLQDAVTGEVEIVYQSHGSWREDEYSEDDDVPTEAAERDDFHHAAMTEYIFLQRPYYMNPHDEQHFLLQFNGQPYVNPSFVFTRARRHQGASPLAQSWCNGDNALQVLDEEAGVTHEPFQELDQQTSCTSTSTFESDAGSESLVNNDEPAILSNAISANAEPEYTQEVTAPTTPALLLQLPNSATTVHSNSSDSEELEEGDDAGAIEENASEASTQVGDIGILKDRDPVDYHVNEDLEDGRYIDADRMMASSLEAGFPSKVGFRNPCKTIASRTTTAHGEHLTLPLDNTLRPHRFFSVDAPQSLIPNMDLFPAQRSMQREIERIVNNLPIFPDEAGEEVMGDSLDTVVPLML